MSFFDLDPIGWMIVGLLAGGLSSLLVGGRAARGCLPNILIGILGGIVGADRRIQERVARARSRAVQRRPIP